MFSVDFNSIIYIFIFKFFYLFIIDIVLNIRSTPYFLNIKLIEYSDNLIIIP